MQNITLLDYVILPFVLAIIYGVAYKTRNNKYSGNHPWRKYYIPALTVKIFGAVFIGMIYQYYYGNGDTFNFYRNAVVLNSSFSESIGKWLNLIFHLPNYYDIDYYNYTSQMSWYNTTSSYAVISITAIFGLLTFNTYLPIAVLFAYFSFSGVWALFKTFAQIYPKYVHSIAVSILFIPSVFVWGSGVFKDTICLFGIGWLTYAMMRVLIQRDFSIKNILLAVISFLLVGIVKIYILIAFIPALGIWILFNYSKFISVKSVRSLVKVLSIVIIGGLFYYTMQSFGSDVLGRYSLENIVETSNKTRGWITTVTMRDDDDASAYDIGEFDPSLQGMLSKFPLAVNVTLFRPYLWEVNKPIIALSAFEAFIFLFLTLKVLFQIGIKKTWKTISEDPNIQFCLTFSIIFAFAVGISTFNFGSLSRYKIPCLPFYALAILLIYYKNAPPGKRILGKWL